jgi:hypothetical protein
MEIKVTYKTPSAIAKEYLHYDILFCLDANNLVSLSSSSWQIVAKCYRVRAKN